MENFNYEPSVWGPQYWFMIHTIGFTFPQMPTTGEKKQYYNFFTSLPLFIPNKNIAARFEILLDENPISPYLTSRESLLKWIHYIHNKINVDLGKKEVPYLEFVNNYVNLYKPKNIVFREELKRRERIIYICVVGGLVLYSLYKCKLN
jgi:hypothetical protein